MTEPQRDEQLIKAVRAFFPAVTDIAPVPGHPNLAKVETADADGPYRVRRWPAGVSPERVRFVHDVHAAAVAAGIEGIPAIERARSAEGQDVVRIGKAFFDATRWIEGRTPERYVAPVLAERSVHLPAALATSTHKELTRRIAEFHQATMPLAARADAPRATLPDLFRAVRTAWQGQRERLRPVAPTRPIIQRWIRTGERALPAAGRVIEQAPPAGPGRPVVGHLSLWPGHVILGRAAGQERVAGIIDFSEAAVGTRLIDLAQLATRFTPWTDEVAELVTGAYGLVSPLLPDERRLLPAIAALDLIAEAGRVLILAYASTDDPRQRPATAARDGAEALVRSLEGATLALLRVEGPDKPMRRRWVHRPPPPGAKGRPKRPGRERPPGPPKKVPGPS